MVGNLGLVNWFGKLLKHHINEQIIQAFNRSFLPSNSEKKS